MPWLGEAMALRMPLRHVHGCLDMYVVSLPSTLARGRCPTPMHVGLDVGSMAGNDLKALWIVHAAKIDCWHRALNARAH